MRRFDPTLLILIVTAIVTLFGALLGLVVGAAATEALTAPLSLMSSGAASLVLGFVLAWHGVSIRESPGRATNAAYWGAVPAAVIGFILAPVLSGVTAYQFGHVGDGILLGLYVGPLVGVIAWELAYWGNEAASKVLPR